MPDNFSDDLQRASLYGVNASEVMRPAVNEQVYMSREAVV